MKGNILIPAILLMLNTIAFAQPPHIKWSAEKEDFWPVWKIIGSDTGGYYVYRNKERIEKSPNVTDGVCIEKRNYNNKIIFTKNYDLKDNGTKYYFIKTLMLKSGPIIIVYEYGTKDYYAYNIGNDGALGNKTLLMNDDDIPKAMLGNGNISEMVQSTKYATHFVVSDDKSALLGYHVNKSDKSTLTVRLFNDNLKQMWSTNVEPNLDDDAKIDQVLTDGKSAYLILCDTKNKEIPKYILCKAEQSGDTKKIDLNPSDGSVCITSLKAKITDDGGMIIGGLTSKYDPNSKFKYNGNTGYCYMHFDISSEKINVNTAENFDKSFMLKYLSEKQIDKGKGIENLGIKGIEENSDKSIILLAEQSTSGVSTFTSYGPNPVAQAGNPAAAPGTFSSYSIGNYEADDIIIVKLKQDGSQEWVQDVPKIQKVDMLGKYYENVGSFGYWIENDKIYLLYNDNKKNEKLNADKMEENRKDIESTRLWPPISTLILETVNLSDGTLKRIPYGNQYGDIQEQDKTMVYCSMAKKVGNIILLYRSDEKNKMEQFGAINIADISN